MCRDKAQGVAIPTENVAELSVTDPRGISKHGCKHRLKITGRATDNLKNLGGSSLLIQRLGKVISALTQFIE